VRLNGIKRQASEISAGIMPPASPRSIADFFFSLPSGRTFLSSQHETFSGIALRLQLGSTQIVPRQRKSYLTSTVVMSTSFKIAEISERWIEKFKLNSRTENGDTIQTRTVDGQTQEIIWKWEGNLGYDDSNNVWLEKDQKSGRLRVVKRLRNSNGQMRSQNRVACWRELRALAILRKASILSPLCYQATQCTYEHSMKSAL